MLERNVDRYGRPRAKLARSTLMREPIRGPSLIPRGVTRSAIFRKWSAAITVRGGRARLSAGWDNLPWIRYHLDGTDKIPRRDVGGITPRGWRAIRDRWAKLPADLIRYGGGR